MSHTSLIESDHFPFEFLSALGEHESWRKEVHRPVYYLHKWWAKRLGSVFRGILLGCQLEADADLKEQFYKIQNFRGVSVLDPFMGSGTTVGEAHKLGFTALGRDINPVAVDAVRVALGPLHRANIQAAYETLEIGVGANIRALYEATDARGRPCEVLYYFWVMTAECPECRHSNDLFSSYIFGRNAYPSRKPEVQVVCPTCGDIFESPTSDRVACCSHGHKFDPNQAPVRGATCVCPGCKANFKVLDAVGRRRPRFRLYAKLILTKEGSKKYLPATDADLVAYAKCSERLIAYSKDLPSLGLTDGYNTRQALSYGFERWVDFFNDRQLLALMMLREGIQKLQDTTAREALLTLFSGVLEFNNLFASYKGEGTGAVRHMFSHHILKPERSPIEANVWGTPKSSGSFSNLYRSRLLRAIDYREAPSEIVLSGTSPRRVCSHPFEGNISEWSALLPPRAIALSSGDSSALTLPERSVDLVVTDPPFFDNVHYSELADFFRAWHVRADAVTSTRAPGEVQDAHPERFAEKLGNVFRECRRILKDEGLLVFSYHHSRAEGWTSLAQAVLDAGFIVVNSHPVRAEMSVATPKTQAKEPIQLDIILVCRKALAVPDKAPNRASALERAQEKVQRLEHAGFKLSRNDRRIVLQGQLMTTLRAVDGAAELGTLVEASLDAAPADARATPALPTSARGQDQQVGTHQLALHLD